MRATIAEAKQMVQDLATQADKLENKHLHDILRDAAGRLHDAENHPDANPQPAPLFPPAQTGEPNPMAQ